MKGADCRKIPRASCLGINAISGAMRNVVDSPMN